MEVIDHNDFEALMRGWTVRSLKLGNVEYVPRPMPAHKLHWTFGQKTAFVESVTLDLEVDYDVAAHPIVAVISVPAGSQAVKVSESHRIYIPFARGKKRVPTKSEVSIYLAQTIEPLRRIIGR